jgi:hypothetical protein
MDWYRVKRRVAQAMHLDLTHNQERYAAALSDAVDPGSKWLNVGCAHNIVTDCAMSLEEQERQTPWLQGWDV